MSSQFTRTLVAMAAALLMSTVAVSAAVAPIQVGTAYPLSNAIGVTLNA
jgi:multidrug transporter EmrE-like cation transporter